MVLLLLLGDKKVPLILKGRGDFWKLLDHARVGKVTVLKSLYTHTTAFLHTYTREFTHM